MRCFYKSNFIGIIIACMLVPSVDLFVSHGMFSARAQDQINAGSASASNGQFQTQIFCQGHSSIDRQSRITPSFPISGDYWAIIKVVEAEWAIFIKEKLNDQNASTGCQRDGLRPDGIMAQVFQKNWSLVQRRQVLDVLWVSVSAPKSDDAKLQTAWVQYLSIGRSMIGTGYSHARVPLRYRFVNCGGEIHIAYGLEPKQIEVGPYVLNGKSIPSTNAPLPMLSSLEVAAKVRWRLEPEVIHYFKDVNTGPALGYGCFTGQTQKIGTVAKLIGVNAKPDEVQAYLEGLFLIDARVDPLRVLRNMALEIDNPAGNKVAEDKARTQSAEARRREEEFQRQEQERLVTYQRQVAEHQQQLAENQRQVAEAAEAQRQYEEKRARQERAAADAQRQFNEKQMQYERERAAWQAQMDARK